MSWIEKLLREPLVHFVFIGAILFGLFGLVGDRTEYESEPLDRIVITPADVERLSGIFSRTWRRPPDRRELQGLVDEYIIEEVLYREALKLGLDRDDTVIRRRMRQKMEFLWSDLNELVGPTDEELQTFFDENRQRFAFEPQLSFHHLYFSIERRGDSAAFEATRILNQLAQGSISYERAVAGSDAFLGPTVMVNAAMSDIASQFGDGFTEELITLDDGNWAGPIESAYGLHVVRIDERVDGSIPALSEVRSEVEIEWQFHRHKAAQEEFYQRLRDRYDISIEWEGVPTDKTAEGALQ